MSPYERDSLTRYLVIGVSAALLACAPAPATPDAGTAPGSSIPHPHAECATMDFDYVLPGLAGPSTPDYTRPGGSVPTPSYESGVTPQSAAHGTMITRELCNLVTALGGSLAPDQDDQLGRLIGPALTNVRIPVPLLTGFLQSGGFGFDSFEFNIQTTSPVSFWYSDVSLPIGARVRGLRSFGIDTSANDDAVLELMRMPRGIDGTSRTVVFQQSGWDATSGLAVVEDSFAPVTVGADEAWSVRLRTLPGFSGTAKFQAAWVIVDLTGTL